MSDRVELATVELLGALAYGQLRSFEVTAHAVRLAPDVGTADGLASFAVREHAGYVRLRERLSELTDLPTAVMDRQRPYFDAYFDRVPLDDWLSASAYFAVGLPIAADFAREVAPTLDERSAAAVVGSLADRDAFERAAVEQLSGQLDGDADARERARHLVADLLGRALTAFQGVMSETDALKVLLDADRGEDETGEARVKRLAIEVLEAHRRRAVALGLEGLEDVT